jgi:outer membrane lipoprotein LolB
MRRAVPSWLRGRAWPDAPSQRPADGFVQLGWQVDAGPLGRRPLDAVRAEAPRVTVRARLETG